MIVRGRKNPLGRLQIREGETSFLSSHSHQARIILGGTGVLQLEQQKGEKCMRNERRRVHNDVVVGTAESEGFPLNVCKSFDIQKKRSFYLSADRSFDFEKKKMVPLVTCTVLYLASKLYIMDLRTLAHEPFWIRHTSLKIMFHHHRTIVEYIQLHIYRPNTYVLNELPRPKRKGKKNNN